MTKSIVSPVSKVSMDKKLTVSYIFNNLLESYLKEHPDKIKEQYNPYTGKLVDILHDMQKTNKMKDNTLIKQLIDNADDLECVNNDNKWKPIHYICMYSTPEIIKYIIDKGVDLECVTEKGWKPIHIICRNSTPEIIKYIIDKGVDLECVVVNGWKPIHFLCVHSIPEIIKYIIDKGVDLKGIADDNTVLKLLQINNPSMVDYYNSKKID